jgi:hypothetical protein
MVNDKLSDIEVKLINSTRGFVYQLNKNGIKDLEIYEIRIEKRDNKTSITIENLFGDKTPIVTLVYPINEDTKEIHLISDSNYSHPNVIPQEYKKILTQEIPEIKDKLVIKWVEYS